MLNNISKIAGVKALDKSAQKQIVGGFGPGEYLESCGPGSDGYACLTGTPHCPTGVCYTGVCVPHTT